MAASRASGRLQAHSRLHSHQSTLRGVLLQAAIAQREVCELAIAHLSTVSKTSKENAISMLVEWHCAGGLSPAGSTTAVGLTQPRAIGTNEVAMVHTQFGPPDSSALRKTRKHRLTRALLSR